MNNQVNLSQFSLVLLEVLQSGGTVKIKAQGDSMYPTIKENSDVLTLVKPSEEIKVNDIALFIRKNSKAVLHRVVEVKNDSVILRGDNQWTTEKIKKSEILAVLQKVERNGKEINYKKYDFCLPVIRWSRRIFNSVKIRLGDRK